MAYDDIIDRTGAAGEIPKHLSEPIVGDVIIMSTLAALGNRVPLTTKDSRVPILSAVPDAGWVSEGGLKPVSKAEWTNETLIAEELATVIVIPDSVVEDSDFPIFDALRPLVARALARKLDAAALFGTNKPSSWTSSALLAAAVAAGNVVTATEDPAEDLLAAAEMVADDEVLPSAAAVKPGWEYGAARARTEAFVANPIGAATPYAGTVAGLGIRTKPVYWESDNAVLLVADWSRVLYGLRQDLRFEMFNSGVLTDAEGNITHNLLQEDKSAMRVTARFAFRMATPMNGSGVAAVPVAAVIPEGS